MPREAGVLLAPVQVPTPQQSSKGKKPKQISKGGKTRGGRPIVQRGISLPVVEGPKPDLELFGWVGSGTTPASRVPG